jgi:hypothetical protein
MHRILFSLDIRPAGYPANLKARYWISGQISSKLNISRITDIQLDILQGNLIPGRTPD